jgi:molybdate transport repressor ModE-like protein
VNLWLWIGGGKGPFSRLGRAELLDAIDRHGPLSKAAFELDMSYRGALGNIKRTEEAPGFKLVERTASSKEGYRLSEAGIELKDNFDCWDRIVQEEVIEKVRNTLNPCGIRIEGKNPRKWKKQRASKRPP